jgi:RHS repeat-associated protein
MVYNFKDQLTEKNIGLNGANSGALQSIDYQYNLRGWLTNINNVALNNGGGATNSIMTPTMTGSSPIQNLAITPFINQAVQNAVQPYRGANANALPPINDNNADLFSQNITYESPATQTGATPQYNGNISSTTWQVLGRDKQAYGFKYDGLDRLTEAKYFDITTQGIAPYASIYNTVDKKYDEIVTYDVRGNITSLKRNGLNGGSWTSNGYTAATYGIIDDLVYNYNPSATNLRAVIANTSSNKLLNVSDISLSDKGFKYIGSAVPTYTYDANGNLTSDLNKDILKIEYNYLNLPTRINFLCYTSGSTKDIYFIYDATGQKQRKVVTQVDCGARNCVTTETVYDYINGVEYLNNKLQRIPHTEGAVVRNEFGAYEHQYDLRDHLGNTRVTFRDGINYGAAGYNAAWQYVDPNAGNTTGLNDGVITTADIKQINHYYPFGLNMEGNWQGGAQGDNKYQYNGKEWNDDFGLGWNDYGARMYDAATARWVAKDFLAEKYTDISPYTYALNNPLRFIDPDGKDIIIVIGSGTGQEFLTYKDNKLYTASGADYTAEKGSFAETVLNSLNKVQEKSETAQSLVKELQEPGFEFKIQESSLKSNFKAEDEVKSRNGTGSGGTVNWNPDKKTAEGVPVVGKKKDDVNPLMTLVHELLGHGIDSKHGTRNDAKAKSAAEGGGLILPMTERWATHVENQIRAETGNSLRTKYDSFPIIKTGTSISIYFDPHIYNKINHITKKSD